jgi:hypothetical protein
MAMGKNVSTKKQGKARRVVCILSALWVFMGLCATQAVRSGVDDVNLQGILSAVILFPSVVLVCSYKANHCNLDRLAERQAQKDVVMAWIECCSAMSLGTGYLIVHRVWMLYTGSDATAFLGNAVLGLMLLTAAVKAVQAYHLTRRAELDD